MGKDIKGECDFLIQWISHRCESAGKHFGVWCPLPLFYTYICTLTLLKLFRMPRVLMEIWSTGILQLIYNYKQGNIPTVLFLTTNIIWTLLFISALMVIFNTHREMHVSSSPDSVSVCDPARRCPCILCLLAVGFAWFSLPCTICCRVVIAASWVVAIKDGGVMAQGGNKCVQHKGENNYEAKDWIFQLGQDLWDETKRFSAFGVKYYTKLYEKHQSYLAHDRLSNQ